MSDFKIGEVAIMCNLKFSPEFNGVEVTITSERIDNAEMDFVDRPGTQRVNGYYIGGLEHIGVYFAAEYQLRKKRPPQETTNWQHVEDTTQWSPVRVPA